MIGALLFGIFLVVILFGVPIGFCMGFMSVVALTVGDGPLVSLSQKMFGGVNNFTYLAIPLFILAGEIMSRCGLTMSIVKFCDALVGHIRGGLAHVNILASMMFAGISGSATADASGLGRIEMEMMTKAGYTKEYSAAVTAASAIIGPIIPPSSIMIIYAVCAGNVSISDMFLGGVVPGILLGVCEMVICYVMARKYNHPCRAQRSSNREILAAFKEALPALGLPIIILGGIITGIFTATESSAIALFYALIVAVCKKSITWKSLMQSCYNTAKMTANTMFIIAVATAMSYSLTILRIPQAIVTAVTGVVGSPFMFLLIVNIILIAIGCVMDQSPALLMMVPILLPMAVEFGIDPLHFGILVCFNLTIGLISPPVGMTLFVTANVAKVKLTDLFKAIIPFTLLGYAVLMLITWFPKIVTFLPYFIKSMNV